LKQAENTSKLKVKSFKKYFFHTVCAFILCFHIFRSLHSPCLQYSFTF